MDRPVSYVKLVVLWFVASILPPAMAQERQPMTDPTIQPAGLPLASPDQPFGVPADAVPIDKVEPAPPGIHCQSVRFDSTWLPKLGASGLGVHEFELSTAVALPFADNMAPLVVTPATAARLWQGPSIAGADLPPAVYDLSLDLGWRPRLAEWLFADLGVTPGLYTDFDEVNSSSFRVRGRGLAIIAFSPQFQLVAGVLYTNRLEVKLLPAGGILWSPNDDTKLQLVFPQPKVAHRLGRHGAADWWAYVTGEFGGGTWTIARAGGGADTVDSTDLRLLGGVECALDQQWTGRLEVGYVFARKLNYRSATPDFEPTDTLVLRAGITF